MEQGLGGQGEMKFAYMAEVFRKEGGLCTGKHGCELFGVIFVHSFPFLPPPLLSMCGGVEVPKKFL